MREGEAQTGGGVKDEPGAYREPGEQPMAAGRTAEEVSAFQWPRDSGNFFF